MEILVFMGAVILFVLVLDARSTIKALRLRIENLENQNSAGLAPMQKPSPADPVSPVRPDPAVAQPIKQAAKSTAKPQRIAEPAAEPSRRVYEPKTVQRDSSAKAEQSQTPKPSMAKRFEDLIGGKLPIWIGGIALIFAGFFLVRFSIEAGLFGPVARCITAAIFGLLLIGLSEFGFKIPKFGKIFTDDLRIGHSIAGAGIAVLYATLYMASELYGLLGLYPALAGLVGVTLLAFLLSQRHGPPTAIMGLLGGFAAPYVAGLGPESVAPLLIYLGIFTAGLFGLAIHRGWAWLALLATGGSVLWTTALLFLDISGDIPFVGAFIVLLAIGGVFTLSKTGTSFGIPQSILQVIPLGVGLLQLVTLAPLIEFSILSWFFFGTLAVFAIALAWRNANLTPAVAGTLLLSVALVASAYIDHGADRLQLFATLALALIFTAAGHLFAARNKDGWMWSLIGVVAPVSFLLVTFVFGELDWADHHWALACLLTAITSAIMAWRTRAFDKILPMAFASGLSAILLAISLWTWIPEIFAALVATAIAALLAIWARFTDRRAIIVQSVLAIAVASVIMLAKSAGLIEGLFESLIGETDLFPYFPEVSRSAVELLLPALAIIAIAFVFRDYMTKIGSRIIAISGCTAVGGFVYLLAKQPLAIGPIEDFVSYGFAERAIFTQVLALSGWLLLRQSWNEKLAASLRTLGVACAALALFRFVYFDIFLLSPTAVKQALGPAPIANLGTIHFAAAMLWLWLFAKNQILVDLLPKSVRPLEIASLLAAIIMVMVTVRQAVHGSDIATPPFSSTETYLYSAGLLALAIAWLARGIQISNSLLRIAGLLLLTLVTFKVFLIDAAQLEGLLRILSFLGLGIALIGIGWMYGKIMRSSETLSTD